jgi:hypothetical protein
VLSCTSAPSWPLARSISSAVATGMRWPLPFRLAFSTPATSSTSASVSTLSRASLRCLRPLEKPALSSLR